MVGDRCRRCVCSGSALREFSISDLSAKALGSFRRPTRHRNEVQSEESPPTSNRISDPAITYYIVQQSEEPCINVTPTSPKSNLYTLNAVCTAFCGAVPIWTPPQLPTYKAPADLFSRLLPHSKAEALALPACHSYRHQQEGTQQQLD